ncbi:methyltransferase domain-containing protein [Dactylosporangium sp. CA-092794]|uniref:methyltransferase domain-containing protein n=1 Tax=Dactylosporangium sp. CA-092794 TaxID=3239929 RepID=UPI003D8FF071
MDIAYLDRAAASDVGRRYKERLLAGLRLRAGDAVLDVGCGPGTDLAALANAVGPAGVVVGIDRDPVMAGQARRRSTATAQVTVIGGDAHALPLGDGSVDRARTDRVLQHLADPARAVAELRRVVRPGGLVALAEPDWDTLVIDDADIATSRAYTRFITTAVVRNAGIGRRLARLLHDAGFEVDAVDASVALFRDYAAADTILQLPAVARRGWEAGALDEQATRAWLARLSAEPFLAALTFFTAIGRAPAARG